MFRTFAKLFASARIVLFSTLVFGQKFIQEPKNMFADLVNKKSFVDKSDLIRLVPEISLFQFIQAPPLFGKSTALHMIKSFFEISVDESGKRVLPKTKTPNYKLFAETPTFLGRKLDIFKDEDFMKKHFGEYPVVLLDFKNVNPVTFTDKELAQDLQTTIRLAFTEHKYLIKSEECLYGNVLKSYFIQSRQISELVQISSLMSNFLFCLFHHYEREVLVLIDEYDYPIRKILLSSAEIATTQYSLNLANFVNYLLKDNDYVPYAFLTGVIRYGEGYPWGATNIMHRSIFLDKKYSPYYGFNDTEVRDLCQRYGRPEMYSKIDDWFNGYSVAECEWKVFNPVSVIDSLVRKNVTTAWAESGFVTDVKKAHLLENLGQDVWEFARDKLLKIGIHIITNYKMRSLKTAIDTGKFGTEEHLALQLLFEHGFFALADTEEFSHIYSVVRTRIPNKEVELALSNYLQAPAEKHTTTEDVSGESVHLGSLH